MQRILVVGTHTGVGKTTFCETLVRLLRSRGVDATGFKPSGEFWVFDHADAVYRCLEEGRLFGHDAEALASASGDGVPPELVAPCYRLMGPDYRLKDLVHQGTGLYAARMTDWSAPNEPVHRYAVVPDLFEAAGISPLLERLRASGSEVREVKAFSDLAPAWEQARRAADSAKAALEARFATLVIESFGFSGLPLLGLDAVDLVLALGTGVAARFEPSGYLEAARAVQAELMERARVTAADVARSHPLYRVFGLAGTRAVAGRVAPEKVVHVRAVASDRRADEWRRVGEALLD